MLNVFDRVGRRQSKREKALPLTGSLPKCSRQLGLDQAKASICEHNPGFPRGWQLPQYMIYHQLSLNMHTNRKPDSGAEQGLKLRHLGDASSSSDILNAKQNAYPNPCFFFSFQPIFISEGAKAWKWRIVSTLLHDKSVQSHFFPKLRNMIRRLQTSSSRKERESRLSGKFTCTCLLLTGGQDQHDIDIGRMNVKLNNPPWAGH